MWGKWGLQSWLQLAEVNILFMSFVSQLCVLTWDSVPLLVSEKWQRYLVWPFILARPSPTCFHFLDLVDQIKHLFQLLSLSNFLFTVSCVNNKDENHFLLLLATLKDEHLLFRDHLRPCPVQNNLYLWIILPEIYLFH